jgi:Flp pilus assembly protein TadG
MVRVSERERGSSAIELVLVTPVLVALVFSVVQAALLWNAQHVTVAAAQQGARLARIAAQSGQTDAQIRAATVDYLHSLGASVTDTPTVAVQRTGAWVTVTVTARAVSLVPGASLTVHGSSRGPVETFTPSLAGGHS